MNLYINGRYLTQDMTGVQRYSHELLRVIDSEPELLRGFDVKLLAPNQDLRFEPKFRRVGLMKVGRRSGHSWEQFDLPRYSEDGLLFCPGNTAPVSRLLRAKPTVVTIHDLSYKYFPGSYALGFRALYGLLMPVVLARAQAIITVSASEASAIGRYYPASSCRITTIQNGGFGLKALESMGAAPAKRVGFPFGLYVGSLSQRKNFPALLEAVSRLVRTTSVGFVFVGGTQAALQRQSMALPEDIRERVRFVGQVNNDVELISWYKGALFFAFPSWYEASPLPPIEAMGCGCPVIASNIAALKERCGDAAEYCDPADAGGIADAMIRVATDAALRQRLKESGARQAARFSWSSCAIATAAVLRRAAESSRL